MRDLRVARRRLARVPPSTCLRIVAPMPASRARRASSAPRYASRTTIRLRGTTPSRASATARQPPRSAPSTRTRSGSQVRAARAAERAERTSPTTTKPWRPRCAARASLAARWSLTMSRRRTESGRGRNMVQGSPARPVDRTPAPSRNLGPFGPATGRERGRHFGAWWTSQGTRGVHHNASPTPTTRAVWRRDRGISRPFGGLMGRFGPPRARRRDARRRDGGGGETGGGRGRGTGTGSLPATASAGRPRQPA